MWPSNDEDRWLLDLPLMFRGAPLTAEVPLLFGGGFALMWTPAQPVKLLWILSEPEKGVSRKMLDKLTQTSDFVSHSIPYTVETL